MKVTIPSKLYIQKRPLPQWLMLFVFVMPFLLTFLQAILHLPSLVKYTIDVAWVVSVVLIFLRRKITLDKKIIPFIIFTAIFLIYTVVFYIFNFQSIFYYLWGFRNNFRFYFAFIAFCMLFTEHDVDICIKFMDILFWINAVASFFQFFVLGYNQDYLGGIFGVERGCNAYSIIFFCIVLSKSVLLLMEKQENIILCFAKCVTALIIAAMAELKFFYVLFILILIISTIMTSFSWRKLSFIILTVITIPIAGAFLSQLFGESSNISLERILALSFAENYASQEDLSRYTAIPTISTDIMTATSERLFGLGLGNCDTSSFAICNTPFFMAYTDLHYTWFSSAFLFLETGYVGLAIFLFFFIMTFVNAFNCSHKENANILYCRMAMIMSIICLILTFYNSSLRFEVAYMAYFVLAIPMITQKKEAEYKRIFNVHI